MREKTDQFAKRLRRNQTDTEKRLWGHMRDRQLGGFKFRRQHAIGNYIVDFYCAEKSLIVELDGGQHIESKRDQKRTGDLQQMGYKIIRFWDHEVLQEIDSVLEAIRLSLNDPHPNPLPKRERGEADRYAQTHD